MNPTNRSQRSNLRSATTEPKGSVSVFRRAIAGTIPALFAHWTAAPPPFSTILWFHGFGVDKETHRAELERFARAGFLAVGIDAVGHGERPRVVPGEARAVLASSRGSFADAQDDTRGADNTRGGDDSFAEMLHLAHATAAEVPTIVDALIAEGRADPDRIAVAGISMGGYVVYRAIEVEPRIRTAVALLAAPHEPDLDALARPALLSITAENDTNVPPHAARTLHEQLHDRAGTRRYLELPGEVHLMSAAAWERTMAETVAWLTGHV